MPEYVILPDSTPQMVIVDITHDDGTFRGRVGFKLTYSDEADLKAQLDAAVQANQVTHYALKAKAAAADPLKALVGKTISVTAPKAPAPVEPAKPV